jgi:hypothetical protein
MATTTSQSTEVRQRTGRLYFWIGLAVPFLGLVLYILQFQARILKMPWYLPVFGTAGVALIIFALVRKTNVWRIAGLILACLVAFLEWFFVAGGLSLPAYTGPIAAGSPFPAFSATFADGSPFTQDSFKGKNTALVFFRGRW